MVCNVEAFIDGQKVYSCSLPNGNLKLEEDLIKISEENKNKMIEALWDVEGRSKTTSYYANGRKIDKDSFKNAVQEYFNQTKESVQRYEEEVQEGFDYSITVALNGKKEIEVDSLSYTTMNDLFNKKYSVKPYIAGYSTTDGGNRERETYIVGESLIKIDGIYGYNEQPVINVIDAYEAWQKEYELWIDFYTMFNDDNPSHAENAFISNGLYYVSAEELHKANVDWFAEIMEHGHTADEICKDIPAAETYKEEALLLFENKQTENICEYDNEI